ncbi:MAG: hypothetical protein M3537_01580 [Chloroflexota bacterium]|nr:hypothetical protein [Chloroflexota bacterium]
MARYRIESTYEQPLRRVEPDTRWKSLRQGDRVSVRTAPGYETTGLIHAVTEDHSAVWVDLDGGRGRTLLHCSDGVEILPPAS